MSASRRILDATRSIAAMRDPSYITSSSRTRNGLRLLTSRYKALHMLGKLRNLMAISEVSDVGGTHRVRVRPVHRREPSRGGMTGKHMKGNPDNSSMHLALGSARVKRRTCVTCGARRNA
ncbi:hypothetical protein KC325_g218 [Hortaea werneckii]|nr:hypothetical protein KC325_g218 [Hortaea werneckii]